ncbi:MAG: radical SAM family heme chaperone HemW [Bacteroidia bacterium]|nr:radical SAM family heme chaperone HemW [Bacteroidia bacterium]
MAGIYVHIPFCRQKCYYCDFHSNPVKTYPESMIASIIKEFELRSEYLAGETIETIYFGGGTPSLLLPGHLSSILDKIHSQFNVSPNSEITIEANPDDLDIELLNFIYKSGINRLSIGIQSFFDDDLKLMNRRHDAKQAVECVLRSQETGFNNISIDLIYGLPASVDSHEHPPNQSMAEKWRQNLETAFDLNIQHLSAYHLSLEGNTVFRFLTQKNKLFLPTEEESYNQFITLVEETEKNGFVHYELSNFAKENYQSRHNSNYWTGKKYLGIGPSAHSFNEISRQWNISDNQKYIDALTQGIVPYKAETLSEKDKYNEYLMISLRTSHGVNLSYIKSAFGDIIHSDLQRSIKGYLQSGHIVLMDNRLVLSVQGMFISDKIISDLFID